MTSTSSWRHIFTFWAEILVALFSTFVVSAQIWSKFVPESLLMVTLGIGLVSAVVAYLIVKSYAGEQKRIRELRIIEESTQKLINDAKASLADRTIDVDILKAELKVLEAKSDEMKALIQAMEKNDRSKAL